MAAYALLNCQTTSSRARSGHLVRILLMKPLLFFLGPLLAPVFGVESQVCQVTIAHARTHTLAAACAICSTKQPAASAPTAPATKSTGKETVKRPALPAHLFM